MTEIFLHGMVSKKFKEYHKFFNIKKATDCIEAIDANHNGFKNFFIQQAERNIFYEIIVDGELVTNARLALEQKEIKKIDIVPAICGSGPIGVAFAVNLALGLIMAGIQYLMTPIPESSPRAAIAQIGAKSFFFASKDNITSQGSSVPLGYGALRIGSRVVETSIRSVDMSSETTSDFVSDSEGGGVY